MKRTDYCLKTIILAEFVGGAQWLVEIHHQGRRIIEYSILPNTISPLPAVVQKQGCWSGFRKAAIQEPALRHLVHVTTSSPVNPKITPHLNGQ